MFKVQLYDGDTLVATGTGATLQDAEESAALNIPSDYVSLLGFSYECEEVQP